jgi:hypothetical protein
MTMRRMPFLLVSLPGLTRQSIHSEDANALRSGMDARVKPAHDELRSSQP